MTRKRLLGMMSDLTDPLGFVARGWQTRAARELGVDRATICRDVDAILGQIFGTGRAKGLDFGFRITCRLLRALLPSPAERRLYGRLGIALPPIGRDVP